MYIDSNVFIYSVIDNRTLGDNCREIIDRIERGKLSGASSYLVLDEVLWILQNEVGKEGSLEANRMFLSLPLKWLNVDRKTMFTSLKFYESTDLDPRDSIHLGSMREAGLTSILSEDGDFDDIEWIERMDAEGYLKQL
ncbi:MAG: type II toxin-antitoxin system VapC family toxin [Thermoplasmatota archaeon]